ncbi:MAG: formate dehydrogenase accessory sulfurtransferase FdhD [Candidatus Eisenbacteria sp.]|nr:formate dehydrogenase accessory sulfurtransferase FdhD [Candidatus Eisenbacteria bacterium]
MHRKSSRRRPVPEDLRDQITVRPVLRIRNGEIRSEDDFLVREEPLEIMISGRTYAITMRSPGDEMALAAGMLFAGGVISRPEDLASISYCSEDARNCIQVTLASSLQLPDGLRLGYPACRTVPSRGPYTQETMESILRGMKRGGRSTQEDVRRIRVDYRSLFDLLDQLTSRQKLFTASGGAHAAALFDVNMGKLAVAEDVGRHNAMDKAIGQAFMSGNLGEVVFCVTSSRGSFEMVLKAASAGAVIMATASAPTDQAIRLADQAGMTLIGFLRAERMNIYTGKDRIK